MLFEIGSFTSLRAEFAKNKALSARVAQLAELYRVPQLAIQANWGLGYGRLRTGELESSLSRLIKAIEEYDFERDRQLAYKWGYNPAVACLTWAAWALWALGYPDQALARSRAAIELSEKTAHPASRALALSVGLIPSCSNGRPRIRPGRLCVANPNDSAGCRRAAGFAAQSSVLKALKLSAPLDLVSNRPTAVSLCTSLQLQCGAPSNVNGHGRGEGPRPASRIARSIRRSGPR
jgi:hypothetical protein